MADEELHEVQLNGKQLVFSFMVVTVVVVVIFLAGVMVGRSMRPPAVAELASGSPDASLDPTVLPAPTSPTGGASDDAPVSAQETLTYPERLDGPTQPADSAKGGDPTDVPLPVSDPVGEPSPATPAPAVAAPPPSPRSTAPSVVQPATAAVRQAPQPAGAASLAEPPGSGYVVQVMAVKTRAEADVIARRLIAKGYPAFVTTTGEGTQRVSYRVRVGKFADRAEADRVFIRLQKEEQFNPWLTR